MSRRSQIADEYKRRFEKPSRAAAPLTRRGFVIGAAGASLVFGFSVGSGQEKSATPLGSLREDAPPFEGYSPTLWYAIGQDGTVSINIKYAEMGQHIATALARIVADELEVAWDKVQVVNVDTDPKWGDMNTGSSYSVFLEFKRLSQAGAAGRIALVEAAARHLGAPPEAYVARNGKVTGPGGSISYGDLVSRSRVERTFSPAQLEALPLKEASERRLIGLEVRALDIPPKVDGSAIYGIDARVEGMLYARPIVPPTRWGSVVSAIDDSAAKQVQGYRRTIALQDPTGLAEGWVVVLADTYPAAMRAASLTHVTWSGGKNGDVDEAQILAFGRGQIDEDSGGALLRDDSDFADATAGAERHVEAEYSTSTVIQFALEPVNAVAWREPDGHWEVLTGCQWQSLALTHLEKAAGVPKGRVVMRAHPLGGGFGRRLFGDYAVTALLASKAIGGAPVKMIAERADDSRNATPRSPFVQKLRAAVAHRQVKAMEHHVSAGWPTLAMKSDDLIEGLNKVRFDPFAIHGAEHLYSLGPQKLRALSNTLASDTFVPGYLRAVASGPVNWAIESFMDELAYSLGEDPLAFRLDRLKAEGRNAGEAPDTVGGAARQAAVLRKVAEMSGYGRALPQDVGMGVACSHGQEREMPTWCACVAVVHVDRSTGRVTCQRLYVAIDCGVIVHPDGAMAQAQGGTLWGVSMALHEGTAIVEGQVRDRNLDTYTPLRMADLPQLNLAFIDSTEYPTGLGEPPVTVPAPAIGNAIFNAVGVRMRHLPIRPEAVLAALNEKRR